MLSRIAFLLVCAVSFAGAADPPSAPAGKIAFVRKGQVSFVNADGSGLVSAADVTYDRPLAWTTSGDRLLYWKHSAAGWDIWAMNPEGKNQQNLTHTATGGTRSPASSPDDKFIACMRDDPEGLYLMQADGTAQKRLADKVDRDAFPAWSPDGKQIAWHDGTDTVRLIDASGQNPATLAKKGRDPVWSTDPQKLLFSQRHGNTYDLCLINPADKKVTNLTNSPDNETHAAWSPDARRIAFHTGLPDGSAELRVIDADGKNLRTLTKLAGRVEKEFSWSPDSAWITYVSGEGQARALYVIAAAGGSPRKLTDGGPHYPVWQPKR